MQWFFKAAGQYFFSKRLIPVLFEVKAHKAHKAQKAHKLKDTQDTESKQKALRKDKANTRAHLLGSKSTYHMTKTI